jgi:hypothetical protein
MLTVKIESCSTSVMILIVDLVAIVAPTELLLISKSVERVVASTELVLRSLRPLIEATVYEATDALIHIRLSLSILAKSSQKMSVIVV